MSRVIPVQYTNYRGETRIRHVVPQSIRWGATKWHPQPQWLIRCVDQDKGADRELALMDCDFTVMEDVRPSEASHAT